MRSLSESDADVVSQMALTPDQAALLSACIDDTHDGDQVIPGRDTVRKAFHKFTAALDDIDFDAITIQPHENRLRSILDDMVNLPLKKGDAFPTPKQLKDVDTTLENNQALFDDIAEALEQDIQASGKTTFTEIYNETQVTNARNKTIIWDNLMKNTEVAEMLKQVATILATSITQPDAESIAWSEIEKFIINSPVQYLNPSTPALILMKKIKGILTRAVAHVMTEKVQHGDMALLPGGEKVEQPPIWTEAIDVAMNCLHMEDTRYVDMLSTPLGQAQTADPSRAESFFRKRETAPGAPHNNFGYVYVSASQQAGTLGVSPLGAVNVPAHPNSNTARTFLYMGEDYVAMPIGQYYTQRTPDIYAKTMASIQNLADHYEGTPAGDYYTKLLNYYNFAENHSNLEGDAFTKGYFDACYDAERAWVAYVKYAQAENLPFIHIHPCEKYRTVSTKEHELALGILEPKETAVYMEGKETFAQNAKAFLDREGITAQWPEMAAESLRVINSAACVSLGARIGSVSGALLAESIPEELAGKEGGIITLFDTQFAQGRLLSLYGNLLTSNDLLGDIAANYKKDIQDLPKFMLHYIMSTLAHELNHNIYQGSRTSFGSDGKGLAVILAEEAKATHGLAISFNDPYNLTFHDLDQLRQAMPLMLPWNIFRLRRVMRSQHTSHLYLREGTTMLEHAIKSGVIEVVGVKVEKAESSDKIQLREVSPAEGDATLIRYNLGDEPLRDYTARIASFLKGLAAPYHQTQFTGALPEGMVVPDITNIEAWQAASFLCYNEQIDGLRTKGETADISRLERERDGLEKTWTPEMEATIRALIDFVDGKEVGKFESAVRKAMSTQTSETELDDAAVHTEIERLKTELRNTRPQIHQGRHL